MPKKYRKQIYLRSDIIIKIQKYYIIHEVKRWITIMKPSIIFTDHSKAVLLLVIVFAICVLCLSLLCCLVCSLHPCDHLLGKGWPLGFLGVMFSCVFVTFPCNMVSWFRFGTWLYLYFELVTSATILNKVSDSKVRKFHKTITAIVQSKMPWPIPLNQTSDFPNWSTLITWRWRHRNHTDAITSLYRYLIEKT